VFNTAWEAHALWLRGFEDRALAAADDAVRTARALGHDYSEALAQAYAAVLHYMRGEPRACAAAADAALALCRSHGFAYYGHWGTILGAWARHRDDPAAAAGAIRAGLGALDDERSWARRPLYLAALAEVLAAGRRSGEAIETLDRAEDHARRSGERMWTPELARLRALLDPPRAAAHARRALDLARQMRAPPLVERATQLLARLDRGGQDVRGPRTLRERSGWQAAAHENQPIAPVARARRVRIIPPEADGPERRGHRQSRGRGPAEDV
jgi:hypothetical protein